MGKQTPTPKQKKQTPKQKEKEERSKWLFVRAVGEPGEKGYITYWGKRHTAARLFGQ